MSTHVDELHAWYVNLRKADPAGQRFLADIVFSEDETKVVGAMME